MVLTGERGSGKSFLVKEIQAEGHRRGQHILYVPKKKGPEKADSKLNNELNRMKRKVELQNYSGFIES